MKKGSKEKKLLGDYLIMPGEFEGLGPLFKQFQKKEFQSLPDYEKQEKVNRALFDLIVKAKTPCFLLPAVLDYLEKINALKLFESYTFSHFEFWLNQFSGVLPAENYEIRGKITGKWIPREEYQTLFPIGMGKTYPGSHFVTAHGSPDLDTTIASFWGWVDAFSARVSDGLHLWNVPGGAPASAVEIGFLFHQMLGEGAFQHLAKTRTTLSLSGIDLTTQKGMVRKMTDESTGMIDHEQGKNAIVLVDKQGYYLGDWRNFDVEGVRQIIMLLNNCLRWFGTHLHLKLISHLAQERFSSQQLSSFVASLLKMKIEEVEPAKEFSLKQRTQLNDYLVKVLKVKKGIASSFEEFATDMKALSLPEFHSFVQLIESLHRSTLFDKKGDLVENRSKIFHALEKLIESLENAIYSVRSYVEKLDVALKIKMKVFGQLPPFVSFRAEVEEIRSKMNNYSYLTVTASDANGKLIPLGIIPAHDVHKSVLGTVTLRDFCNREETKIPSYLEVISVIDHHKSSLHTGSAPMVILSDAQSSNVLVAELAFAINDRFGTGGMGLNQIEKQLKEMKSFSSSSDKRVMQRLLQKMIVAEQKGGFFIDPRREAVEYLHFLYGILDDTDLLTKVSQRDIECVAQLINRLKSLMLGREVEEIAFDDLKRDGAFVQRAASRILQHPDMYSLYRKIYLSKEESVGENLKRCSRGQPSSVFIDTKEQNGCVRVGQTKLFARNYATFAKNVEGIQQQWFDQLLSFYEGRKEVDLHMHMISTVEGAEDLFAGTIKGFDHQDELWIWIPFTEQSIEHLKSFLNAFSTSPQILKNTLSAEFYGAKAKAYEQIFEESFLPIPMKAVSSKRQLSIAVLKYNAGSINSRKGMISPYLPKLVD